MRRFLTKEEKPIFRERLFNILKKYNTFEKQKKILEKCLIISGNLKSLTFSDEDGEDLVDDSFKEYEKRRLPTFQPAQFQQFYDYDIDLAQGDIATYSTGIAGAQGTLQKSQQRGILREDQIIGMINEIYENVLDQLKIDNVIIKNQAIEMYKFILNYYHTNKFNLKINKGSLKKGYIGMVLFYALTSNGISISKSKITNLLGIELRDLPEADKNIKLIFGNDNVIFKITKINLCGMDELLPNNIIKQIYETMEKMKETFGDPMNKSQIAACIYYVCKPIKQKINGKLITYGMLSESCEGNPTEKTIKSNVDLIKATLL